MYGVHTELVDCMDFVGDIFLRYITKWAKQFSSKYLAGENLTSSEYKVDILDDCGSQTSKDIKILEFQIDSYLMYFNVAAATDFAFMNDSDVATSGPLKLIHPFWWDLLCPWYMVSILEWGMRI